MIRTTCACQPDDTLAKLPKECLIAYNDYTVFVKHFYSYSKLATQGLIAYHKRYF